MCSTAAGDMEQVFCTASSPLCRRTSPLRLLVSIVRAGGWPLHLKFRRAAPRSVQPPQRSSRGCGSAQPDAAALRVGKLGVKLSFFHVKCNLGLAGVKQTAPSEGFSTWAFGWRLDLDAQVRLKSLFDVVKSGAEATSPPGLPHNQGPPGAAPPLERAGGSVLG